MICNLQCNTCGFRNNEQVIAGDVSHLTTISWPCSSQQCAHQPKTQTIIDRCTSPPSESRFARPSSTVSAPCPTSCRQCNGLTFKNVLKCTGCGTIQ